eukprot:763259-Hanusia_phi.AAC.2
MMFLKGESGSRDVRFAEAMARLAAGKPAAPRMLGGSGRRRGREIERTCSECSRIMLKLQNEVAKIKIKLTSQCDSSIGCRAQGSRRTLMEYA